MASTRQLKDRINSVGNTKQITRAMQLIAASKMRRAQEAAKITIPYTDAGHQLLRRLSSQITTDNHPLFLKRAIKKRLIIFIASDKGLAGAYNVNLFKKYIELLNLDHARGIQNVTITIGRKASTLASRLQDNEIIGAYDSLPDDPNGASFNAILTTATDMYINKNIDAVTVVYMDFINSMVQEARWLRLLPAGTELSSDPASISTDNDEYLYEPTPQIVLDAVAHRMIMAKLLQTLLDARASEHSMRMVAMKSATDNASDLIEDLTLAMNKARQGAITQELAEISGGVEALS